MDEQLIQMTGRALESGRSKAEIDAALAHAGWPEHARKGALAAWVEAPGMPPIPTPRPYIPAREAFFFGLLFLVLCCLCWNLARAGFILIDVTFPDGDRFALSWHLDSLRWNMAALIAVVPLFWWLHRRANQSAGAEGPPRSLVRRWLSSLTLLISAITLLGAAIFIAYSLLNGDLTARIMARTALTVLLAGLVWGYFRDELDG
ncbi:MAG: DUF5671 domain-containing protein [Paracoccus sp. (in: a-proteobacteria)]|nr:DUF5671 domain-containing protein [Paracoccus sp. (in: a-proteobacteria)]